MIPQDIFSIENTLESLLNVEPENRFYQSLQKQYHVGKTLTNNQIECLRKDYKEKINGTPAPISAAPTQTTQNIVAPAETEKCVLEHPHAGPHKYSEEEKKDFEKDSAPESNTYENWKNGTMPAPETISQQPSIEEFLGNFLSSPDYGTREKIIDPETIKAILSLIKDRMVRDCSHYHGYDPQIEAKYQKTTLMFKGNQLFKNGVALDCGLDDPMFDGMRINNCRDSIQILLDFYHPEEGYSMKCVNFDVRREGTRKENTSASNRSADTDKTAKNSNFVLTDTRSRSKEQLEIEYGPMNQAKAIVLWNNSKISYKEYEQFISAAEKETSQQETKEREADADELMSIETPAGFIQEEKNPEKEQNQKRLF